MRRPPRKNVSLSPPIFGLKKIERLGSGVADGIRTRNNKLHKLGLYH